MKTKDHPEVATLNFVKRARTHYLYTSMGLMNILDTKSRYSANKVYLEIFNWKIKLFYSQKAFFNEEVNLTLVWRE